MAYLLDTCVVSELSRRSPANSVVSWLRNIPSDNLFISAATLGEIRKGIARLPDGDMRRIALGKWFHSVLAAFSSRIIPFDAEIAVEWGNMIGRSLREGRPRPLIDSQIAATALCRDMVLVTRNVADMDGLGVIIINPFAPSPRDL